MAGGEQLARREVGAGAVVEGAGASLSWFCFAANSRTSCVIFIEQKLSSLRSFAAPADAASARARTSSQS
ncbi:MAG TPA: hypothetical protein VKY80_07900, partial [Croceibacterium sp.]|nr:hypothetical protein [Croceibacterium sp.]